MNLWLVSVILPDGVVHSKNFLVMMVERTPPQSDWAWENYLDRVRDKVRQSHDFDDTNFPFGYKLYPDLVEFDAKGVANIS